VECDKFHRHNLSNYAGLVKNKWAYLKTHCNFRVHVRHVPRPALPTTLDCMQMCIAQTVSQKLSTTLVENCTLP